MTLDMYSEKVAEASALIREFAKVDYFHYFARDPESSLEEFIAMLDQAEEKGRQEQAARIAELERQLEEDEDLIAQTSHGAAARISATRAEVLEEAALAVENLGDTNPPMSYGIRCAEVIRALASAPAVEQQGKEAIPKDKWVVGRREVWFTKTRPRRSTGMYGGYEWACNNCDWSPGPSDVPHHHCVNCGETLATTASDGAAIWRVEVETTSYGYRRISEERFVSAAAPQAADTDKVREALKLAIRQNSHDMLMTGEEIRQCEAALHSMAAQAAVREVPEGWRLVPIEATQEMVNAAFGEDTASIRDTFKAMLAAAPLPAAPVQQEGDRG